LGPYEYDLEYWQNQTKSLKPLPFDNTVVWNKIWQFSPPTRFGEKYKSTLVNAANIHLYTYANVIDIESNEPVSEITSATITNFSGRKQKVKARHFIMACCSIQNARLLLASNKQAPNGLGNENDLVGRYFMEHLEIKSAEIYLNHPDPLDLYKLQPPHVRAELAITADKQKEYKILNGTASFLPLEIARKQAPNIATWE
jgi:choline dehydrogenase-like flavoprotein